MRKAFMFLLILLIVGIVGYLIFPKTGKLPTSLKTLTSGITGPSTTGQDASGGTVTEVSEGLALDITSPVDTSTVNTSALQVIGKTSPNVEVFVNDQEGKSDSTGNFFINVSLVEGENILTIVVSDDSGNFAERELTVYLESTE